MPSHKVAPIVAHAESLSLIYSENFNITLTWKQSSCIPSNF